jgi:hypothetical protein
LLQCLACLQKPASSRPPAVASVVAHAKISWRVAQTDEARQEPGFRTLRRRHLRPAISAVPNA